jgi:cell division protein ZapA
MMARITLTVGGRDYDVAVRDGDEPRFRALALMVDEKVVQAARVGGLTENRQLLFAALLLADELDAARTAAPPAVPPPAIDAAAIERLAERAEALAERLERGAGAP